MAELEEISKRRKQPSLQTTPSLMGTFTRSKSPTHLHRNSSGQSTPVYGGGGNRQYTQPFGRKRKNISPAEDSSVGCDFSSVSVKDLRSRRVFSPSFADGVIRNCLGDIENLEKSEVAGNRFGGSQKACEDREFQKLDMPNEDILQSTPPDAEILGAKQEGAIYGSDFSDQFLEKKSSENLQRSDGNSEKGFHDKRNGINYPTRSVLKPCSRVKLFKTPGSVSYRRLLPYLMDMEKGSPDMVTCNNDFGKELNTVSVESLTSQDSESSSRPLNGVIQKLDLQVSCEDCNLNCSKHDSSSSIKDSNFKEQKLDGVVSSGKMMTTGVEVAETSAESPYNAQNIQVLDQSVSTVSDRCGSCDYDEVKQNSNDERKQSEITGMPRVTICQSSDAQQLNSVNPAPSELRGKKKCSLRQRVDNDSEVLEQVEVLNGECMLVTSPDSDMSSKLETEDSRGNKVDCVPQGMNHVIERSTDGACHSSNDQNSDKRQDSSLKKKTAHDLSLHLKLSKIPGLFSYRRLLPYLKEITNDYSCASKNDESIKVEQSSAENLFSPFSTSSEEICMETFNGKSCPIDQDAAADGMLPVAAATSTRFSSNPKLKGSPHKQVADSPLKMDSQKEQGSTVKNAALDTNQRLQSRPENVVESPAISSSSLINSGILSREEGAKLVSHQLPLETEEDCINSTVKCANLEKQMEADNFVGASIPPGIPTASLKKGILKRNPRGCRGICTCLNCSSFRLHAERSFEFSRNQMQDAEEVALGLIKELSYLRNMLEKSAFGSKDQTSRYINQVNDACKKASEAEELAKTRLREMNSDLKIHCRTPCWQRPSVRFANYVEEQVIPVADSSSQ